MATRELTADELLARLAANATAPPPGPAGISRWADRTGALRAEEASWLQQYEQNPSAHAAIAALGRVYTGAGNTARAEWFLARAIELDPSDADSWIQLGINRLIKNEPREALALLARAKELSPDATLAWAKAGEAWARLGDDAAAAEEFRGALERSPRQLDARLGLARILEESGDLEGAHAQLERALDVEGDSPTALFRLAGVLHALGRTAEARQIERLHERAAILEDLRLRGSTASRSAKHAAIGMRFLGDGRFDEARIELESGAVHARDDAERIAAVAGLVQLARATGEQIAETEERLRALAPAHPLLAP